MDLKKKSPRKLKKNRLDLTRMSWTTRKAVAKEEADLGPSWIRVRGSHTWKTWKAPRTLRGAEEMSDGGLRVIARSRKEKARTLLRSGLVEACS